MTETMSRCGSKRFTDGLVPIAIDLELLEIAVPAHAGENRAGAGKAGGPWPTDRCLGTGKVRLTELHPLRKVPRWTWAGDDEPIG
jgi:hypothetical protein